jgi:hypothetical protein
MAGPSVTDGGMYLISSQGQPTWGDLSAWELGRMLIIPHSEKQAYYEMLHRTLNLVGFYEV